MRPRTDEILRSLLWTFDEWIEPETTTPFARSLALTMGNLMRHVILRVELEGDLLFEDNRELRQLLARIAGYAQGEDRGLAALGDRISGALAARYWGGDVYPSVARLVEEATALRWALTDAIRELQARRARLGESQDYRDVRRDIRDYLGRQLDREGKMIEPAFVGERR